MRKIILINCLLLFVVCSRAQSDRSFSYSPDSSVLSILLDKAKIDKSTSSFTIDLKGKWYYKKSDSIKVDLRGKLMTQKQGQLDNIEVTVFGKKYKTKINSDSNAKLSFPGLVKNYKKNPTIKVTWVKKPKKGDNKTFYIDSFDLGIPRPKK